MSSIEAEFLEGAMLFALAVIGPHISHLKGCAIGDMAGMPVSERILWVERLAPKEKKAMLARCASCLEAGGVESLEKDALVQCYLALRGIQQRLGSHEERPDDMHEAVKLGHQLRNMTMIRALG